MACSRFSSVTDVSSEEDEFQSCSDDDLNPLSRKDTATDVSDKGLETNPVHQNSKDIVDGKLSEAEKEKRKILKKTRSKLQKLKRRVEEALQDTAEKEKALDTSMEKVEGVRKETEKRLTDHVKYLYTLLEHYHQEQQQLLRQRHKQFLEQVMVAKTESMNFKSKMADVQREVEENVSCINDDSDMTAADVENVDALRSKFNSQSGIKPNFKVTVDEVQSLLGYVEICGDAADAATGTSSPPKPGKAKSPKAAPQQGSSNEKASAKRPSQSAPDVESSSSSKDKASNNATSGSSSGTSESSQAKKKAKRLRQAQRRKARAEAAKAERTQVPKLTAIVDCGEDTLPAPVASRAVEVRGIGARPDGQLWVVYGSNDPHLDLVTADGKVVESTRIGGNAINVASFGVEGVLLSQHSPCVQLRVMGDDKKVAEIVELPFTSTGLGVGSTGIAVTGKKCLYWIPLDGGKNQWIVKNEGSSLKAVCSCDIVVAQGKEIVCLADREGHKVWFFEKLENGEFVPLPLFTYSVQKKSGESVPFSPTCVSALVGTFIVAVLDSVSTSVIMVDVENNNTLSLVSGKRLCSGPPSIIGFAHTAPEEEPKLWVGSTRGKLFLVPLQRLYSL